MKSRYKKKYNFQTRNPLHFRDKSSTKKPYSTHLTQKRIVTIVKDSSDYVDSRPLNGAFLVSGAPFLRFSGTKVWKVNTDKGQDLFSIILISQCIISAVIQSGALRECMEFRKKKAADESRCLLLRKRWWFSAKVSFLFWLSDFYIDWVWDDVWIMLRQLRWVLHVQFILIQSGVYNYWVEVINVLEWI